jgi:hypothetical protein
VIVDEDPRLHLIWHQDKIFVKPIPPYLLSRAFWEYVQEADGALCRAAAGFMRTYAFLIKHDIDFRKATSPKLALIPLVIASHQVTFEDFSDFISHFERLSDESVCPRYSYGEIRLTRLNHLTRLILHKWSYFHLRWGLADTLGNFLAPFFTLFAVLSILLNCLQVELGVQNVVSEGIWPTFLGMSQWFPVFVILLVFSLLASVALFLILILLKEGLFSLKVLRIRRKGKSKARSLSSVVVG